MQTNPLSALICRPAGFAAALVSLLVLALAEPGCAQTAPNSRYAANTLLTGQDALNQDWSDDTPGLGFYIKLSDLPQPYATPSAGNDPHVVPRPSGAWPQAPAGFTVTQVATDLSNPRKIVTAPNGDLFIAESGANQVRVIRLGADGKPVVNQVFVDGLRQPFGLAFYPSGPNPQYLYIANTDSVVRCAYHVGDVQATAQPSTIVDNLSGGGRLRGGGHWTRDVVFSKDGTRMFVSVGSHSNIQDTQDDVPLEQRRARIFTYNPDGSGEQVYATGIRNAVGLAINPATGQLWMSTNERDGLGDNLVPDYISHVEEGGFYGWPWYWMGGHTDPRALGDHPDLSAKVITPDVLLQPHSASLCIIFYARGEFPRDFDQDAFACEHGSWNRARRTGYKVVRVEMKHGKATGVYRDFLTGFVTSDGQVWGRPVGVTEGNDGSLFVTDDGSNSLWQVKYTGARK